MGLPSEACRATAYGGSSFSSCFMQLRREHRESKGTLANRYSKPEKSQGTGMPIMHPRAPCSMSNGVEFCIIVVKRLDQTCVPLLQE